MAPSRGYVHKIIKCFAFSIHVHIFSGFKPRQKRNEHSFAFHPPSPLSCSLLRFYLISMFNRQLVPCSSLHFISSCCIYVIFNWDFNRCSFAVVHVTRVSRKSNSFFSYAKYTRIRSKPTENIQQIVVFFIHNKTRKKINILIFCNMNVNKFTAEKSASIPDVCKRFAQNFPANDKLENIHILIEFAAFLVRHCSGAHRD